METQTADYGKGFRCCKYGTCNDHSYYVTCLL